MKHASYETTGEVASPKIGFLGIIIGGYMEDSSMQRKPQYLC
jgi:hypothetical protein